VVPDPGCDRLNYLDICDGARSADAAEAHQVAGGHSFVVERQRKELFDRISVSFATEQRLFLLTVTLPGWTTAAMGRGHAPGRDGAEAYRRKVCAPSEFRFRQMAEKHPRRVLPHR
jgi:hypothetical protein